MRKVYWVLGFVLLGSCAGTHDETSRAAKVHALLMEDVRALAASVKGLQTVVEQSDTTQANRNKMRRAFEEARAHYKASEYLVEYLVPRVAKRINGPALFKVEAEPDEIVNKKPNGFQVIEAFVFDGFKPEQKAEVSSEVVYLNKLVGQLETNLKASTLKDRQVFEAMRYQIVRILSLGISGFDSPVAFRSLPEAQVSLKRMRQALEVYGHDPALQTLTQSLDRAVAYVGRPDQTFEGFDRATFIRDYLTPVSRDLLAAQKALDIPLPTYQTPLKSDFTSVFTEKAFDIMAFAPDDAQGSNGIWAAVGKTLFYDNALAGGGERNCASCHLHNQAFTDGLPLAVSTDGNQMGMRNTPTILNAGLSRTTAFDLSAATLEDRVEKVLRNPKELHTTPEEVGKKLRTVPEYMQLFEKAFGRSGKTDAEVGRQAVLAIAAYMRTQTGMNSPFDRYLRGEKAEVSASAIRGFNLFMGKAKCGTCHFAPLYNGTVPPAYMEAESEVLGVPSQNVTQNATIDADVGKYVLYQSPLHMHAFKTSTVRNAALTAPYMHNGVYATLDEVLDFYNRGGAAGIGIKLENQTLPIAPLKLSAQELADLKAFMEHLSDTSMISDPPTSFPKIPPGSLANRK